MQEADYSLLFSLLSANYGFTPDYIYERLTWPQVRMYLKQIPTLEFRRHFPIAKLTASVLNIMGGKPKPGEQASVDFNPWSPLELMPSYAQLEDMVFNPLGVTRRSAEQFLKLSAEGKLPNWVIAISNLAQIRAAAGKSP